MSTDFMALLLQSGWKYLAQGHYTRKTLELFLVDYQIYVAKHQAAIWSLKDAPIEDESDDEDVLDELQAVRATL